MGFTVTFRDVTAEEFAALRILEFERQDYQQEQDKRQAQFQQARAQAGKQSF